jgi:hypothetical protein
MPQTAILTPEQLDAFDRQGVVRLPGFYPESDIRAMADGLWADIERRFGMLRDRPESWAVSLPAQFKGLVRSGAFDALGSAKMAGLADALLGAGAWDPPSNWATPLVTFPKAKWGLPRPPWHTDTGACRYLNPMPVLRAFTFLEPVRPGGGGTLYVGGSHRLALEMDRAPDGSILRSAEIRKRLGAEHPWFAHLLAAPGVGYREWMGVDAQCGVHTVRLEEMTGAPGDLILMHPAILHALAQNALDQPRMMLTISVYRHGAYGD